MVLTCLRPPGLPRQRHRGRGLQTDAFILTLWRLKSKLTAPRPRCLVRPAPPAPRGQACSLAVSSCDRRGAIARASNTSAVRGNVSTFAFGEGVAGTQTAATPSTLSLPSFPSWASESRRGQWLPHETRGSCLSQLASSVAPDQRLLRGEGAHSLNGLQSSRSMQDPKLGTSLPCAREEVISSFT